jgi:hypothetical protein
MSEVENKRTPRPLKGTDIFLLTSIIGKLGVKNLMCCFDAPDVREARENGEGDNVEKLGQLVFLGVIDVVLARLEYCEGSICKLLSKLYDMPEADIKDLGATEYLNMFVDVVKDENFVDFFKQAYESVKRMM